MQTRKNINKIKLNENQFEFRKRYKEKLFVIKINNSKTKFPNVQL